MISYSTNMMGPITLKWYEDRGIQITNGVPEQTYYGGRIDIYGLDYDEYFDGRTEYAVSVMKGEHWWALSSFLKGYETEELVSYETLIGDFEEQIGKKTEWWID